MNTKTVAAVFDTHATTERAIADLRAAGVPDSALSVIGRDGLTETDGVATGDAHSDSLVTGGPADDTIESKPVARGLLGGAALGSLLGVAALAIPGVGPFIAAGAIASAAIPGAMATGALIGAGAGGLREALNHHGMHDEEAAYFEEHLTEGRVLLAVDVATSGIETADIADIMERAGGRNSRTANSVTEAATAAA